MVPNSIRFFRLFQLESFQAKIMNIKLFDGVALTSDLPEYNLRRGQVGTVVEILADGKAFEVEFSDRDGRTYQSVGLRPDQIMVLHYEPIKTEPISAVE